MEAHDILAKGRLLCRVLISGGIRHRFPGLDGQSVHLARPGRGKMGEVSSRGLCALAMRLFRLIPAIIGLVHVRDCGGFHLRRLERVSCGICRPKMYSAWLYYRQMLIGDDTRWLIYATATILGSTASFYVSRTVLSRFVTRLMEHDKRFAALALTLKYDGLKLLCMIRLCPLPYSICNGAISTFPTVQPLMYGLATAIISPKLLVPAFVGSRVRLLTEKGGEMSAGTKAVNIISIIATISIGGGTAYYIYQRLVVALVQLLHL